MTTSKFTSGLKLKKNPRSPFERKPSNRLLRIAELIRCELLTLLQTRVRDPRISHVVINRVEVFADLSDAKVFVSLDGNEHEQEQALDGLRHAAGFLRSLMSARINMRTIPHLRFIHETIDPEKRYIEELILQASTEKLKS